MCVCHGDVWVGVVAEAQVGSDLIAEVVEIAHANCLTVWTDPEFTSGNKNLEMTSLLQTHLCHAHKHTVQFIYQWL